MAGAVLGLLLSPGAAPARAGDGGPTNPDFVRIQQGTIIDQFRVSCETTSTALYNNPAAVEGGGVRSITMRNTGVNSVYICAAASCTTTTAVAFLGAKDAVTLDKSVRAIVWSCISTGGASVVVGFAERG